MADQIGQAVLTVSVNDATQAGLDKAKGNVDKAANQMAGAFGRVTDAVKTLAGVAGLVGIGAITQQIIAAGQASERSKIQLTALAGAYGESDMAMQAAARTAKVLGISTLDAREGFAQLYASLRGTGLGLKQLEVLFVGVSNAARLSGAGTLEAQAALLQLRQGLASGRLQGDELRSVLEQLPALAQEIAAVMKRNVGDLRQLGSEGKITSDIIFEAAKRLAGATAPGRAQVEQLGIAYKDLKEAAAEAFGPGLVKVITQVTAGIAAFSQYVKDNKESLVGFASGVIEFGKALAPFVVGIMAVQAAFKAWALAAKGVALAQAAVLALSGPKGWAVLALAAGATAAAYKGIETALKGIEGASGKAAAEGKKAVAEFQKLLGGTSLEGGSGSAGGLGAGLQTGTNTIKNAMKAVQDAKLAQQQAANKIVALQRQRAEQADVALGPNVPDRLRLKPSELEAAFKAADKSGQNLRKALFEGANAIAEAINAAADRLTNARLGLSELKGSRDQGLNQFLSDADRQKRLNSAGRLIAPEVGAAIKQAQQILGADGISLPQNLRDELNSYIALANGKKILQAAPMGMNGTINGQPIYKPTMVGGGITEDMLKRMQDIIRATQQERSAIRAVNVAGRSMEEINAELTSVNADLATAVQDLAKKDWSVVVNVAGSGASVSGDVLNRAVS